MSADFPSKLWVRDPVVDGRPLSGGALNRAIALLAQCRDEVAAIETALGTNVHGSAASLAARLNVHHSPSGLRRGFVYALRGPNPVGAAKGNAENWWQGGNTYIQVGSNASTTTVTTITFPTAYFAGNPPSYVIAKYHNQNLTGLIGSVQVLYDSITTTQFQTTAKQIKSDGTWQAAGSGESYKINWIAFGGAPA